MLLKLLFLIDLIRWVRFGWLDCGPIAAAGGHIDALEPTMTRESSSLFLAVKKAAAKQPKERAETLPDICLVAA